MVSVIISLLVSGAAASPGETLSEDAWRDLPKDLQRPDPAERIEALDRLDGSATATHQLEIVLRTDPAETVRRAAWEQLAQRYERGEDPEGSRALLEWLRDEGAALDRQRASQILDPGAPPPSARTHDYGKTATLSWTTAYGAYVGGVGGYLVGEAMEADEAAHIAQGVAPGAAIGAGVGLGTGLLLISQLPTREQDVAVMASGSTLGTFAGYEIGRALIPTGADGDVERIHAAGLAGSMAGTGLGMLIAPRSPRPLQVLHVDLASGLGWQVGAGAADMARLDPGEDRALRAASELGGATVLGGLAAISGRLDTPTAPTLALAVGHGAWIGAMSPFLFSDSPTALQHLGGARVGLGLGYLSVLGASAVGQPDGKSAALQSIGVVAGNAIGAGIPLSVGSEGHPRAVVGPALAGGIAGQALGAVIAPHFELSDEDAFLVSTLGAWTAYQTAGWGVYAGSVNDSPTRPLGYALTAGGAGTLATLGVARFIDVPASGSAQLLAAGGWGTWFGGWTSQLVDAGDDTRWLVTLGGGNAALLGTAVAEGAGWTPTWRQVGLINGMGTLGAAAGGLVGVIGLYDADNWDPLVASTLVGSGLGLAGGAVLAARPPKERALASALRLPGTPSLSARPWVGEDGDPGAYVEVGLRGW